MRKPMVNYKDFRLSKINSPEFSHLKYLVIWIIYGISHILTESLISPERCFTVHSKIDDLIPFCEIFIIPYVLWYLFVDLTVLYFAFYDVDIFKKLSKYIVIIQIISVAAYILLPTKQELRPLVMPRDNIFTDAVSFLYSIDTNTGVCPSIHVGYSIAVASAWLRYKDAGKLWKIFAVLLAVSICLSTVFIKQHSVIDIVAAISVCVIAEFVVYGKKNQSFISSSTVQTTQQP
jgi:membrane-associated phospholipid phosphatase